MPMKRLFSIATLAATLLTSDIAIAADRTVTLAVKNMTCASCPYIVRKTLAAVPGVSRAEVSFEEKTVTVTFDDEKTSVTTLAEATAIAGYPATVQE